METWTVQDWIALVLFGTLMMSVAIAAIIVLLTFNDEEE